MADIKQLEETFNQLKARESRITMAGVELVVPEGYIAEMGQTAIGFKVQMIKLSARDITLVAEKRVEQIWQYYDPQGKLVAEQYVDTGWEPSGPPLITGAELPSDYNQPSRRRHS